MNNFDEYAYYYNLFYKNKDYASEAKTVSSLIEKHTNGSNKPKTLLNLGCGTGRHDVEFTKLGYQVKGIDLSKNMISEAKTNYNKYGIDFAVGDVRTYRDSVKYDVCTSLFHVISYQNSNKDLSEAFTTAYEELQSGGLFVFDCWYGPGVLSEKPEVRIKHVEDDNNVVIRHAVPVMYPEKNIAEINYEVLIINKENRSVHSLKETHSMRYLFKPEIDFLLNDSGFELLDCIDCNTLEKTTFNSWTAYFIARKK